MSRKKPSTTVKESEASSSTSAFPLENYTEIDEPSPLDRILADERNYNGGNWTSEELKKLFDGVHKYGTGKGAINYILRNLVKQRTEIEIKAKIDEIREIIKEHKESVMPEFYHKIWIESGHRNIVPPLDSEVNPDESWTTIIGKVNTHHHSSINKHPNPMREAFEKLFDEFSKESKVQEDVPVTSMQTARARPTNTQTVRWPLIYQFMKACSSLEEQMPALNELEASIVANVLDTIEDEASTIPDREKAIMAGVFNECQIGDFRFCEQDCPADAQSGTRLYVDPLRTRAHGVPEVAAEVESQTYNNPSSN